MCEITNLTPVWYISDPVVAVYVLSKPFLKARFMIDVLPTLLGPRTAMWYVSATSYLAGCVGVISCCSLSSIGGCGVSIKELRDIEKSVVRLIHSCGV